MQVITVLLPDAEATRSLGKQFGQQLPPSTVMLLEGDLGSGKTTFVQGLGAGLGISTPIDSPTFALINEYVEGRFPLYHFDLYRLNPGETVRLCPELYWEGIETEPGLVAIEWADRLSYLPESYLYLHFYHQPEAGRRVEIMAQGETAMAILTAMNLPAYNH